MQSQNNLNRIGLVSFVAFVTFVAMSENQQTSKTDLFHVLLKHIETNDAASFEKEFSMLSDTLKCCYFPYCVFLSLKLNLFPIFKIINSWAPSIISQHIIFVLINVDEHQKAKQTLSTTLAKSEDFADVFVLLLKVSRHLKTTDLTNALLDYIEKY